MWWPAVKLRWLGFSSQAIKTLVARARLHRISRGVYALGHKRLTAKGRWMAGVLACGPGAVLSHAEAAALHDLRQIGSGPVNVTAPRRHELEGIRCHWARRLSAGDTTVVDGIPVTSVARTYLDLAEIVTHRRLIDVLEAGQRQDKLDVSAVRVVIAHNPGRHGIKVLADAVAELTDEPPLLQSGLELAFRHLTSTYDLPQPQFNGVVRFTEDQVELDPAGVAAELSELLRDGPWPPPARSDP